MASFASKKSKPSVQLFALTTDKVNFYYGELHDDHILRGSPRGIYASNIKILDMSAEWKAYLTGRVIEIEQADSKYVKVTLKPSGLKYMLQHDTGYVMPLIRVGSEDLCAYFPRMTTMAPVTMPSQTARAPGIVMSSGSAKPSRRRVVIKEDDSIAGAVCNGDEDPVDEGKKERDALSSAIERGFIRVWR